MPTIGFEIKNGSARSAAKYLSQKHSTAITVLLNVAK